MTNVPEVYIKTQSAVNALTELIEEADETDRRLSLTLVLLKKAEEILFEVGNEQEPWG